MPLFMHISAWASAPLFQLIPSIPASASGTHAAAHFDVCEEDGTVVPYHSHSDLLAAAGMEIRSLLNFRFVIFFLWLWQGSVVNYSARNKCEKCSTLVACIALASELSHGHAVISQYMWALSIRNWTGNFSDSWPTCLSQNNLICIFTGTYTPILISVCTKIWVNSWAFLAIFLLDPFPSFLGRITN